MPSQLYSPLDAALTDMFTVQGDTFSWQGQSYPCVINQGSDTLTTSKTLFPNQGYPRQGQVITVQGKGRLVKALANSEHQFAAGGTVSPGIPFVDDGSVPTLTIAYGGFVRG